MSPATQIVHWPGSEVPACDAHANKLVALGASMGLRVSSSPCAGSLICTNCANEERKATALDRPQEQER